MIDTYYNVGSKEDPVYSNSAGSALNPEQGGSIQKFLNFFTEKEEKKESLALSNGKLVHLYAEHPAEFVIADVEIPTGMLGSFTEELYKELESFKNFPEGISEVSTVITSNLQKENAQQAQILETDSAFTDLAHLLKVNKDVAIALFRKARKEFYVSYTEAKLIEHFRANGWKYFQYLQSTENKIVLTKEDKARVEGCTGALWDNKKARYLLQLDPEMKTEDEVFKEVPIFWDEIVKFPDIHDNKQINVITVKCKARLDVVRVNHAQKIIIIPDLKTKKGSLYTFGKSLEFYRYYRQSAFYKRAIKFWFNQQYPDKQIEEYNCKLLNVVVESDGMHLCGIYTLGDVWVAKGKHEYQSLLSRLAFHRHYKIYDASREEIVSKDGIMLLSMDALGQPIIC